MASASSMLADLDVKPRVTVHETRAAVLTKAKLEVSVAPASYAARARLVIKPRDGTRFSKSAKVARGSLSARIPLNFLGKAAVVVRLPQDLGLEASSATGNITSVAPKLSRGDRSAAVKPLLKRLKGLGFHTPKHTNRITKKVGDVILAFRKSQSLKRTKSMGRSTWREVLAAKPVKARYPKPGTHIEVDKKQQLMMVVRGGNVIGTMHVSSGLTGNTPEGSFRVFQRGGSPLYRFMAFLGNYGLHGYLSVPAYPASHGCVRIPMWAADWAWFKTQMGTEVIVYR
jgi:N-acetylmuramoyl-L-alanine amidase